MSLEARYVVGIDLGTSNSALSFADLNEARAHKTPRIQQLEIPQLYGPGDLQEKPLLPSAIYLAADFEISAEQAELPWNAGQASRQLTGEIARRMGAKSANRLIDSAKSWLCHGGVNRSAKILPWHAPEDQPRRSPVEAQAAILAHLHQAWDTVMAKGDDALKLVHQKVFLTVPASFDEVSRQLSLEAAKQAGLPELTLIEEPLAVFYAFLAKTGGRPESTGLSGGERVLIADVGGGTTDLTLIEVKAPSEPGGLLGFERTAVGDHLLLGGDNMDLALAHVLEPTMSGQKRLDAEGWAALRLAAREAKETLFSHPSREALPIAVAGRGSKLIGNTRRGELSQSKLKDVVLDGFFPALLPEEAGGPRAKSQKSGFHEYGLPFAEDPGITRHIAGFLMRQAAPDARFVPIDALLFNGGALKPSILRDRLSHVLGDWMRSFDPQIADPRPLIYDEGDLPLELSVSRGAAYFGLVKSGLGLRVGGGSPRAYFIGVSEGRETAQDAPIRVIAVAPRGMQDGERLELPGEDLMLTVNRPVQFPLFFTTAPRSDTVGDIVSFPKGELTELAPLQTVVKFGKQKPGSQLPVRLQVTRTEIGTLELSCFSKMSGARFRLEFQLRGEGDASDGSEATQTQATASRSAPSTEPFLGAGNRPPPELGEVSTEGLEAAKARLRALFAERAPRPDPKTAMKGLEADLQLDRDAFPLPVLRELAECLLEQMPARQLHPDLEERWLNLMGFCLRPGFGVPLDEWRVRQLWRIHQEGPIHPNTGSVALNWWITWRRVAGGLSRGHQQELAARLMPLINPALARRASQKPPKSDSQLAAEMWRCAAALERLSAKAKVQLGGNFLEQLEAGRAPRGALWCMGRIGARRLLYGPREATVKASVVHGWAERLLKLKTIPKGDDLPSAILSLARVSGDRQLDLDEARRLSLKEALLARGADPESLRPLTERIELSQNQTRLALGDSLPTGFTLLQDAQNDAQNADD